MESRPDRRGPPRCVVEAGYVFVHDPDGRIAASVSILWNDPLIWGPDNGNSGYVHMLIVDRAWAGHGFGERALAWTEQYISGSGKDRGRLDVTVSNDTLQGWYVEPGLRNGRHSGVRPSRLEPCRPSPEERLRSERVIRITQR